MNVLDAKCLQPYCLSICSTKYMGSMESTLELWWLIIIEFDAKYHRRNNSISDPNEHHSLVNVDVERLLYMLRTIHHRRFVEIGMKSVQELITNATNNIRHCSGELCKCAPMHWLNIYSRIPVPNNKQNKRNYLIWCSRSEVMRVHTFSRFIFIHIVNC